MVYTSLIAAGLSALNAVTTLAVQKVVSDHPYLKDCYGKIAHTYLAVRMTSLFAADPHSASINCAVVVIDSVSIQLINALSARTVGNISEMIIEASLFGALAASGAPIGKVIVSRAAFSVIMTELFSLRKTEPIRT